MSSASGRVRVTSSTASSAFSGARLSTTGDDTGTTQYQLSGGGFVWPVTQYDIGGYVAAYSGGGGAVNASALGFVVPADGIYRVDWIMQGFIDGGILFSTFPRTVCIHESGGTPISYTSPWASSVGSHLQAHDLNDTGTAGGFTKWLAAGDLVYARTALSADMDNEYIYRASHTISLLRAGALP